MSFARRLLLCLPAAATAIALLAAGCSTTNNLNNGGGTSGLGEACSRTFDCKGSLVCLGDVCLPPSASGGDASVGDGGSEASTGPHRGLLTESCQTTNDCQAPLECIKNECSIISFGLTATSMSCTGECNAAADCCELPVGFSANIPSGLVYPPDGGSPTYTNGLFGPTRCEDLLNYLGGDASICGGSTVTANNSEACFYYATYCKCAASTWSCTNNSCVYSAPCTGTSSRGSIGACPTETRTSRALSATCNIAGAATTGSCQAGCAADSDCSGKVPAGYSLTQATCANADAGAGDCTCYQSACYFKCTKDLDCASGYSCDTTVHLCKAAGCMNNANCVQSTGNPRSQCTAGVCETSCANDRECNPPATICSSGFCKPSGCGSDSDCNTGASHMFCVMATTTMYTSAATN